MSAGGARRGRRDNGLDANEYAVVGDVDPRVGEHLLDVLAAGGIAAYLQPSADLNPVTRTTTVPARPVDRLYVDRSHLTTARDYLTQLADESTPEQPPRRDEPDIDAEWARIVAGFHTTSTRRRAPVAGRGGRGRRRRPDEPAGRPAGPLRRRRAAVRPPPTCAGCRPRPTSRGSRSAGARPDEPSLLDGLDTFGADLPDDERRTRVTPRRRRRRCPASRSTRWSACSAWSSGSCSSSSRRLLPVDRSAVTLFGFTGILAGFVTLIWRLRPGDEDEDDPDNGAVV